MRWGKSTDGVHHLVDPALAGFPVAWYAPTNKNLAESWELIKKTFQPVTTRKLEDKHILELLNGGRIDAWSLENPDSSRGRKYKLVVIDEAAHTRNLEYAWTQVIRQRLTDFRGGAWFLSTPFGRNYFQVLFDRGQDPNDREWKSWQMPTITNPFIHPSEIESARADMSDLAFAQEYMAQFVTWEGAVFRNILDAVDIALLTEPEKHHKYVIGVDWGKQNDYTVFAVMDPAPEIEVDGEKVRTAPALVHLDRMRSVPYTLQRERLKVLRENWNNAHVVAEVNAMGEPILEQLKADGVPVEAFYTSNASKAEAIQALALAFEQKAIRVLNNPVLLGELAAFEGKKLASGLMRYEAPAGQHDDTVIALAIAWDSAKVAQQRAKPVTIVTIPKRDSWVRAAGHYPASREI